jgi:nucleoside-diphosphate-sugar epimerase
LGLGIAAWVFFGIYKTVIRFFNSKDYLKMVFIILLIHLLNLILDIIIPSQYFLMPEIFFISFCITSCYIIGSRFLINYLYFYYNNAKSASNQKSILIYGAGELGVFIKKSINTTYRGEFKIVAFLDDDHQKIDRFIGGLKVYDVDQSMDELIKKHNIVEIIIAHSTLEPSKKSSFLKKALNHNLKVREVASIQSFFENGFNLNNLSNIDINDLMNRAPIVLADNHIIESVNNKVVLVTGAAGSIGSEIVRKLSLHSAKFIICIDFSESALFDLQQEMASKFPHQSYQFILSDIREKELMQTIIKENSPSFIYHAAAYKHVPLMEVYPWEAVNTNFMATAELAQLAIHHGCEKFIFISSDKAINPTSVMGATKRLAEIYLQSLSKTSQATKFVITRFGNVLGSNGSVVPVFKRQIQQGGPITVTHPEMVRYFMTISEACQLVIEASVIAKGGEVFIFDMGEPVKIVDLARNMIKLAGYRPEIDIKIEFTGQRPGEKLFEELFTRDELQSTTRNEKIFICKNVNADDFDRASCILKINSIKTIKNPVSYKKLLKDLVPEYVFDEKIVTPSNLNIK